MGRGDAFIHGDRSDPISGRTLAVRALQVCCCAFCEGGGLLMTGECVAGGGHVFGRERGGRLGRYKALREGAVRSEAAPRLGGDIGLGKSNREGAGARGD